MDGDIAKETEKEWTDTQEENCEGEIGRRNSIQEGRVVNSVKNHREVKKNEDHCENEGGKATKRPLVVLERVVSFE